MPPSTASVAPRSDPVGRLEQLTGRQVERACDIGHDFGPPSLVVLAWGRMRGWSRDVPGSARPPAPAQPNGLFAGDPGLAARAVGIRRRPVRLVPAPGRLPGASAARMTAIGRAGDERRSKRRVRYVVWRVAKLAYSRQRRGSRAARGAATPGVWQSVATMPWAWLSRRADRLRPVRRRGLAVQPAIRCTGCGAWPRSAGTRWPRSRSWPGGHGGPAASTSRSP